MNMENKKNFLERYEFMLPLGLFLLFLALTLPGIAWGAPNMWHPDEVVIRAINGLEDPAYRFDEYNFDYPTLPVYTYYFLGKLIMALGAPLSQVLLAARILSAVLAGLTVALTYLMARRLGGSVTVAGLAGLLLVCVGEMQHNGRFAHNDVFLLFFSTLTILLVIEYYNRGSKLWLYASFLTVGMAASCKYIGGSLILLPVAVYVLGQWRLHPRQWLATLETLFIGAVLAFGGYALGTPKAFLWLAWYLKRLLSALDWQVSYGRRPDSVRGIVGQYALINEGLGPALSLLFGAALVWAIWWLWQAYRHKTMDRASGGLAILLGAIVLLDLPMTISYNYQIRYFLTLMPVLAILAAFFLDHVYTLARQQGGWYPRALQAAVGLVMLYSLARILSLMLLVMNDARIPASAFVASLPKESTLEHTYYPPSIPEKHFANEFNYPIYFVKGNEPVPTSKNMVFNAGEAGLNERETDYLVLDSYTWEKFNDPFTCERMPVECAFFKQLETGRSEHYRLLAEFKYTLPPYLPQIQFNFINPSIRIYERVP